MVCASVVARLGSGLLDSGVRMGEKLESSRLVGGEEHWLWSVEPVSFCVRDPPMLCPCGVESSDALLNACCQ